MRSMNDFIALSVILLFVLAGCLPENASSESESARLAKQTVMVKEVFFTLRDTLDNVDSPAVWHGNEDEHWLLATAKETDLLLVFDAGSGERVKRVGGSGPAAGQFDRPNGIAVIDDIVIVVERDNHRLQVLSLPEFEPLGMIGEAELIRPYGLTAVETSPTNYTVYVTDNYETPDEQVPADSLLDERVKEFHFSISNGHFKAEYIGAFGEVQGDGILHVVESLFADPVHDRLLIAEEIEERSSLIGYNLDGKFNGEVIDETYFPNQAEGIALFSCPDDTGYWIATDQADDQSTFHVFDRKSLAHLGSFQGEETKNTDGIALTQQAFASFQAGAFFAVHDDGNVAAFSWGQIAAQLGIKAKCS